MIQRALLSYFGGTWEQIIDAFLYLTDTNIGETGGSSTTGAATGNTGAASGNTGATSGNTGSTVLTTSNLPARTVVRTYLTSSQSSTCTANDTASANTYSFHCLGDSGETNSSGHTHTLESHTHTLNSHTHTLGSHTHTQNLPVHIKTYGWRRTA